MNAGFWILLVVLLGYFIYRIGKETTGPAARAKDMQMLAYEMAGEQVKCLFRNPTLADLIDVPAPELYHSVANVWEFRGTVLYGGIDHRYKCEIRYNGGDATKGRSWTVTQCYLMDVDGIK